MSVSKPARGVEGVLVMNMEGRILVRQGVAQDPRISAIVSNPEWMEDARQRRIVPVRLTGKELVALFTETDGGILVVLSAIPSDNVLNFIINVDFAYDILDHLLTDPYEAMAIVDSDERLVFISPVHENFFGLRPGEGIGKSGREVIENSRLHHVVRTGVAEVGQIHRMNGRERVVSRYPIRHDGKVVGAFGRIMFKGPAQLDAMARRINALEEEIAEYKAVSHTREHGEEFLNAIIGQSAAIQSVRQQIRKIAPIDIPVLIQGESGTGKELVAKALHMMSQRQDERLVTVNAAALPDTLVESELFGYEPGSFTGADKKGRAGKFELAHKGTIFLDEIGDMPLEVQSKLLRVLQDRIVERVGGDKPKHVDFRLCSATNRDLEHMVDEGKFRLDLYYRISPVRIVMPSLQERLEDIPLLLSHFIGEMAKQYHRSVPEVDPGVHEYLMERQWPGNVRQLRHVIERAFVFAEPGRLSVDDFLHDSTSPAPRTARLSSPAAEPVHATGTLKEKLEKLENDLIEDMMIRFKGNKKRVAAQLGISRSYLYKKLETM